MSGQKMDYSCGNEGLFSMCCKMYIATDICLIFSAFYFSRLLPFSFPRRILSNLALQDTMSETKMFRKVMFRGIQVELDYFEVDP